MIRLHSWSSCHLRRPQFSSISCICGIFLLILSDLSVIKVQYVLCCCHILLQIAVAPFVSTLWHLCRLRSSSVSTCQNVLQQRYKGFRDCAPDSSRFLESRHLEILLQLQRHLSALLATRKISGVYLARQRRLSGGSSERGILRNDMMMILFAFCPQIQIKDCLSLVPLHASISRLYGLPFL